MKNSVSFDILCGVCKGNIKLVDNKVLKCERCGKETDAEFVSNFLRPKYDGKIRLMEIINQHSARFYFNGTD